MRDKDDTAAVPEAQPAPERAGGQGPWRVLLLAAVFALVIGAGGFVASRTVARNRSVVAPMCIDSQCTAAMSADSSSSMTMPDNSTMDHSDGMLSESDVLGQAVSDLLRLLHLR